MPPTQPALPISLLIITTLLILLPTTHTQQWYQKNNPHFINQSQYTRLVINPTTRNPGVTLLKFFTPWCRYCKYLKDIIDDLRAKESWAITVYEVNCDEVNYDFCGMMGVRSFPKIIFFEDGEAKENMDGFYPYQVVRELFVKWNRTAEAVGHNEGLKHEEDRKHEEDERKEVKVENSQPATDSQTPKEEIKQVVPEEQGNYVEPQIVQPVVVAPESVKQPIIEQPPQQLQQPQKPQQSQQPQQPQQPQPKQPQPQQHHQSTTQSPSPPSSTPPPSPPSTPPSPPSTSHIKRSQQMIEQQENIAIIDQDIKETESQKKLVEDMQKKANEASTSTIDLSTLLPSDSTTRQYGKYSFYVICVLVGGYYFIHIMKADPHHQEHSSSKHNTHRATTSQSSQSSSSRPLHIPANISIQDSQLREQLNFEHPNEEDAMMECVEIRDEDL